MLSSRRWPRDSRLSRVVVCRVQLLIASVRIFFPGWLQPPAETNSGYHPERRSHALSPRNQFRSAGGTPIPFVSRGGGHVCVSPRTASTLRRRSSLAYSSFWTTHHYSNPEPYSGSSTVYSKQQLAISGSKYFSFGPGRRDHTYQYIRERRAGWGGSACKFRHRR